MVFGLLAIGLLFWEILYHQNANRWPVWALLLPGIGCIYLATRQDAVDQSWWWMALLLSLGVGYFTYLGFVMDERVKKRR